MTNSNLVGRTTGKSLTFAPFALKNAAGVVARLAKGLHQIGSVANQPTFKRVFALSVQGRNRFTRRQRDELSAPSAIEILIGHNHERRDPLIDESRKGRVDFSRRSGADDEK